MDVKNIPRIMRANRMPVGARLMDGWFLRTTATAPKYGTVDTTTVTMNWALGFLRAKAVFDGIVSGKVWMNDAAQRVIEKKLKDNGLLVATPQNFGDLSKTPTMLDAEQINQRAVGMSGMTESLDDMDAALGNFVFQIVVAGTVSPKAGGGHRVEIKEVGIYIRDSYDFNGYQYLGCWNDANDTVSRNPLAFGDTVYNEDFRDWRAANGMGGDYMIYSDLTRIARTPPDTFSLPVPPPAPAVKPPREFGPKW